MRETVGMTPRTNDGRPLHLLDADAYVVAVDTATQAEISDRVLGKVWYSFGPPGPGTISSVWMFNPDEMGERNGTTLTLTADARKARVLCFVHGEPAFEFLRSFRAYRRGTVILDWGLAYDLMA